MDEGPLDDVGSHYFGDVLSVAYPVEGLHSGLLLLVTKGEDQNQVRT